jgi:hypothetical protein
MAFKIPCVHDYTTELCSKEAEVIQNYRNANVCAIGRGEGIQVEA